MTFPDSRDQGREAAPAAAPPRRPSTLRRLAPALVLAAAAVSVYAAYGDYLSFERLAEHSDRLTAWRDAHQVLSVLVYGIVYAVVVALSLPGAVWLTLAGGFLFGIWTATLATVVSATLGATALFLVARTSLGDLLLERAGPWLARLRRGFRRDAASYLLMLRLIPVVPFFVVNLAPAFLGVPLRLFVWTTLVGIAPGVVVFAAIGDGLGGVLEAGETPQIDVLLTPPLLAPLLALAALSALPLALRLWRRRRGSKGAKANRERKAGRAAT